MEEESAPEVKDTAYREGQQVPLALFPPRFGRGGNMVVIYGICAVTMVAVGIFLTHMGVYRHFTQSASEDTATLNQNASSSVTDTAEDFARYYKVASDTVWYKDFFQGYIAVSGADAKTFELMKAYGKDCSIGPYAKDKNFVYDGGAVIRKADPHSFEVMGYPYAKDAQYVFLADEKHIIADADPSTFVPFDFPVGETCAGKTYPYARDAHHVWCDGGQAADADPSTFELLDAEYAKDRARVYELHAGCQKISGADVSTFTVLGRGFAKDNAHVYLHQVGWDTDEFATLEGVDVATFTLIPDSFLAKDKNAVYYQYPRSYFQSMPTTVPTLAVLVGADAGSFSKEQGFFGDKNNVYIQPSTCCKEGAIPTLKAVSGVDRASFFSLGNSYYKDKDRVYYEYTPLLDADPDSFSVLSDVKIDNGFAGFSRDKNYLYLRDTPLDGVNPNGFKIVDGRYAENDERVIYLNTQYTEYSPTRVKSVDFLPNADRVTFNVLGGDYAKDQGAVYFDGRPLRGAESQTFAYLGVVSPGNEAYAKDKNHLYSGEKSVVFPSVSYGTSEGDLSSFVLLSGFYARDKSAVYYVAWNGVPATPADTYGSRPASAVYKLYADPLTFHLIQRKTANVGDDWYLRYGVDSSSVYFMDGQAHLLPNADPTSFEVFTNDDYSKDKTHVWYNGELVEGADPATFQTENNNAFRAHDAMYIYQGYERIGRVE